jgi:shikimate kinase
MNIVLIGYRGTGKSTIAQIVARTLSWPVVSLDQELVRREGRRIPDIVAEQGWPYFRDREEALVEELGQRDQTVLDCGGGVVERPSNFQRLRDSGTVFWLRARPDTIISRIASDLDRPALTQQSFTSEVVEVLSRRAPLYARMAHVQLDTDGVPPAVLASRIIELWPRP